MTLSPLTRLAVICDGTDSYALPYATMPYATCTQLQPAQPELAKLALIWSNS